MVVYRGRRNRLACCYSRGGNRRGVDGFADHRVSTVQLALHAIRTLQVIRVYMRRLHNLRTQQGRQQQGRQPAGLQQGDACFHGREKLR